MSILLLTEAHVPSDLCRRGRNQPQHVLRVTDPTSLGAPRA